MRTRRESRGFLRAPLLAAGAVLFSSLLLQLIPSVAFAENDPARRIAVLTAVVGDVLVIRDGASAPERAAFGTRLSPGDQLVTGGDGKVRFLLDGKAVVALQPESRLALELAALRLVTGRLGVGLATGLLSPGETVAVQTSNAAASLVRGSLSAEHVPAGRAEAGRGIAVAAAGPDGVVAVQPPAAPEARSGFFVTSGQASVSVTGQPPLPLGPSQGIGVSGAATLAQVVPYGGPGPADAIQVTPARQSRGHREGPGLSLQMGAATVLAWQLLSSIPTLSSAPVLASLPPRPAEPIGPALKDPPRPPVGPAQSSAEPPIPPTPPTTEGSSGGGSPIVTPQGGGEPSDGVMFTVQGKTFTWEQELFSFDGGSVIIDGGGAILRMVDCLLTATRPIVSMLNGTLDVKLDTQSAGVIELVRTQASFQQGGFLLDKSFLSIQDVPLLHVGPGSSVTMNGDFIAALNGSKITVLRAPLISVNGGTLDIAGALASFGGTGGNQLVISNSLVPTATVSGVPVRTDAASTVSIGPNPFPGLGTLGTVSLTGSAIQSVNGGTVTIAAPAIPLPVTPPSGSGAASGSITISPPAGAVVPGGSVPILGGAVSIAPSGSGVSTGGGDITITGVSNSAVPSGVTTNPPVTLSGSNLSLGTAGRLILSGSQAGSTGGAGAALTVGPGR